MSIIGDGPLSCMVGTKSCEKGDGVAKPAEEETNARLASASILDWMGVSTYKAKRTPSGEI